MRLIQATEPPLWASYYVPHICHSVGHTTVALLAEAQWTWDLNSGLNSRVPAKPVICLEPGDRPITLVQVFQRVDQKTFHHEVRHIRYWISRNVFSPYCRGSPGGQGTATSSQEILSLSNPTLEGSGVWGELP